MLTITLMQISSMCLYDTEGCEGGTAAHSPFDSGSDACFISRVVGTGHVQGRCRVQSLDSYLWPVCLATSRELAMAWGRPDLLRLQSLAVIRVPDRTRRPFRRRVQVQSDYVDSLMMRALLSLGVVVQGMNILE